MKKVHTYVLCIMSQLINKIHFRISKDHFLVKYANLQSGMKTFDLVHQRNKNKKNEAIMNAEESVFVLTPIGRI